MHEDEDDDLMEPPYYDMLTVKFRGDDYEVTLPYCEVANGDITAVKKDSIEIIVIKTGPEKIKMSYDEFTKVIETTFDTKEVVELWVQLAGTYESILIYEYES